MSSSVPNIQPIIDEIDKNGVAYGNWSEEKRNAIIKKGYLISTDLKNARFKAVVFERDPDVEKSIKLKKTVYRSGKKRISEDICEAYKVLGYLIIQKENKRSSHCQWSDAYDICTCYNCTRPEEFHIVGYYITAIAQND